MSKQDNNSTIHCVCIVIRAHMINAAKENVVPLPQYDDFKDNEFVNHSLRREDKEHCSLSLVRLVNYVSG